VSVEPGGEAGAMFDYDSRPVTRQVVLIGRRSSADAYAIRDFLTRNGRPYEWIDDDQARVADHLPDAAALDSWRLPVCILPDGTRLEAATVEEVAAGLGMLAGPRLAEYDLTIIGAGPAGLAAAVYAASEGLRTLVVEAVAPGGQAGTTSMIENYLGFPGGISGSQLASRATVQAEQFGAEILLARRLVGVSLEGGIYVSKLSDGTRVLSRALLLSTGVSWRRLDVPLVERLLGAGVYYGAGPSEARACRGAGVVVVGGGNSAGQACVRFSRYAARVTLLVRGPALGASMSQYLVNTIARIDNVDVRTGMEVVGIDGDDRLRTISVSPTHGGAPDELRTDALFICIGGVPHTEGTERLPLRRDLHGYLMTGTDGDDAGSRAAGWRLERPPFPLETNLPGLFVAGDVRHGSTKRCATAVGEGAMAVALVHRHLADDLGA
jgi:thioredoxin reductase (NADPH)